MSVRVQVPIPFLVTKIVFYRTGPFGVVNRKQSSSRNPSEEA